MILGTTLALIGAGMILIGSGLQTDKNHKAYKEAQKAYETYRSNLEKTGLGKADTRQIIDRAYEDGDLTFEEYEGAIKEYENFEKRYKKGDTFYTYFNGETSFKNLKKFYNVMNKKSGTIAAASYETADQLKGDISNALRSTLPNIKDAPGYTAFDAEFENKSQEAEYMKLWSGRELAELHGIDYDVDTYYDLVKKGTQANLDYTDYLSRQMNEASMVDDTKNVTSYLDAIRNNKAEALASGATAGARAAQEVLATKSAMDSYADKQLDVASQRYNTVEDALLADAQAKITARDYFNSLAQHLATDSGTLYANDAERYSAEQDMYARIYSSNEALRQAYLDANAGMFASNVSAQASINAARSAAQSEVDEYMWMLDRYIGANNGNAKQAQLDFEDYLRARARDGHYSYVNDYLGK